MMRAWILMYVWIYGRPAFRKARLASVAFALVASGRQANPSIAKPVDHVQQ